MTEPLVVRRETQIAAPPATVFAFLTDPEKILSWMGTEATTEAHPGGLYLLKGCGGDRARVARGAFREVPPGSSLVEIDLIDRDGGTLLRMTIAVFRTPSSAPATIGVGRITWAGSPSRPPAEIPASIVAQRRTIVNSSSACRFSER